MASIRLVSVCTAFIAFIFLGWGPGHAATEAKRVALVIGNSAYQNTAVLNNPVRDATEMAAALDRLGFDVIKGLDLDQAEMYAKIKEFTSRIDGADVTLFYYAGHGFQIDGKNYLAPVDATLSRESDVDFETVPLNLVLRQMERERRTNIVFLDACRDNPLATKLARSLKGRSVSVSRGLARVESGVGTLIGYSTSPGMVAFDGDGEHSPYTKALLKHIEKPGVSINDMMISVRQDVLEESKGKQIPWEHSSLTGRYYFKEPVQVATATTEESKPATTAETQAATGTSVATAYAATVAVGTCRAYRIFEEQHRSTFYGRLAEEYIRSNCEQSKQRQIRVEEASATPPAADTATATVKPQSAPVAAAEPKETAAPEPATTREEIVVAASQPAAETPAPPAEGKPDLGAMTLEIQKQLARLGCNPGNPDGVWGRRTSRAMSSFNEAASLALETGEPTEAALTALKGKSGVVCARVVKTAPAKTTKPKVAVTKRKPAPKKRPPTAVRRKPKQDEYWGGEDTRVQCERGAWNLDCFKKR